MSEDIFEDLEKSIEDAFKPEEKKRIKVKHSDDIDGTHWYRYSTHNHQFQDDYMRNDAYDKLMFGPNRHKIVSDSIRCDKCGSNIKFEMIQEFDNMRYHQILNRPIEYRIYDLFCPICANMFRTTGKVIEINVEVRQ